ncbi:MAG: Tfp pilus assembly protein FimT/FimU, partial [Candidatus Aminicenantia bacterium]
MTNKQKISNYQLSIINSRLPVVSSCSTVALQHRSTNRGFTLAELVVATAVMVIFVVGALTLYVRSNKLAVDQQQLAQTQHDVRSSMFLISRDV